MINKNVIFEIADFAFYISEEIEVEQSILIDLLPSPERGVEKLDIPISIDDISVSDYDDIAFNVVNFINNYAEENSIVRIFLTENFLDLCAQ